MSQQTNLEKCEHLVRNHPANKELMELEVYEPAERLKLVEDTILELKKILDLNHVSVDLARSASMAIGEYEKATQHRHLEERIFRLSKQVTQPQLQHYLRVLELYGDTRYESIQIEDGIMTVSAPSGGVTSFREDVGDRYDTGVNYDFYVIHFNLTTGKPATEKDALEFIKLVS